MLLPIVTLAVSSLLSVGLTSGHSVSHVGQGLTRDEVSITDGPPRTKPLLLDIPGLPKLPKIRTDDRVAAARDSILPLEDIQGDILIGQHKPLETFYFFSINDNATFKSAFTKSVLPLITSASHILAADPTDQPSALVNIAFSATGLTTLGIDEESMLDFGFSRGQEIDLSNLGDPSADDWVESFKDRRTHGVFIVASDSTDRIETALKTITGALGKAMKKQHRLDGAARPGKEAGREHFGFLDGVSQPTITGFNDDGRFPLGDDVIQAIPPGIILTGMDGDIGVDTRPSWMKGGSFLAFRQLKQLVPEFNKFLNDNPTDGSSELTGARMVGRWKSGAPIDLAPTADDPQLGADRTRNNVFNYTHPEIPTFNVSDDQTRCPFSAHVRKVRPRIDNVFNINQIMRSSIPYGPEVTAKEKESSKTTKERGLAFVSYQSNLGLGFHFLMFLWANNKFFPFGKSVSVPGFDPIISQNHGDGRFMSGIDPKDPSKNLDLPTAFVQSRGGEYFYSPSISALSSTILA